MKQDTYKYLSIVLAITTALFAYMYFTQPKPTIGDIYSDVGENLSNCSDEIAAWEEEYGAQASSTAKEDALKDVLESCQEELSAGRGQLDDSN